MEQVWKRGVQGLKDELIKEKEQLHSELAKVKEEVKEERKQSTESSTLVTKINPVQEKPREI